LGPSVTFVLETIPVGVVYLVASPVR